MRTNKLYLLIVLCGMLVGCDYTPPTNRVVSKKYVPAYRKNVMERWDDMDKNREVTKHYPEEFLLEVETDWHIKGFSPIRRTISVSNSTFFDASIDEIIPQEKLHR